MTCCNKKKKCCLKKVLFFILLLITLGTAAYFYRDYLLSLYKEHEKDIHKVMDKANNKAHSLAKDGEKIIKEKRDLVEQKLS